MRRRETRRGAVETHVDPSFLRWPYETPPYEPVATDWNAIGVVGYKNSRPSSADLTTFMNEFIEDVKVATVTVVQDNGGKYDPSNASPQATCRLSCRRSASRR